MKPTTDFLYHAAQYGSVWVRESKVNAKRKHLQDVLSSVGEMHITNKT